MQHSSGFAATATLIITAATHAQFTGEYAGETWSLVAAGLGGSSAVFSDSQLVLTGADATVGGFALIDATHLVTTDGTWTFNWSYTSSNSPGYDDAYYLHNGIVTYLTDTSGMSGVISVAVSAGDIIGWRVSTGDGMVGPGVLTITNFSIPAPGAAALLVLAAATHRRRRA